MIKKQEWHETQEPFTKTRNKLDSEYSLAFSSFRYKWILSNKYRIDKANDEHIK